MPSISSTLVDYIWSVGSNHSPTLNGKRMTCIKQIIADTDPKDLIQIGNEFPIICASRWDLYEIVILLLDKGVDPNTQDQCGNTALHVCHDPILARILIRYGANKLIKNKQGETPHKHVQHHFDTLRASHETIYFRQLKDLREVLE